MKVTVHGPNLTDQTLGSFRVHAFSAKADNEREVNLNGSKSPETIEVASREDVIDHLYPAAEHDREPDDLPMFLADCYFGESCGSLPTINEENSMAEYTNEQKTAALEEYGKSGSYRKVGEAMSVSATTAKKIVEQAKAEAAETAAQMKRATSPRKPREGAKPVADEPDKTAVCNQCEKDGKPDAAKPLTSEFWYKNTAAGEFWLGLCKSCHKARRAAGKARKAAASAAASPETPTVEAQSTSETTESERHLTAVA